MRIWLLDILACPICKHYPLDLRVFSWETDEKAFSSIESAFKSHQLPALEENCILTLPNGKKDKCIKVVENGQLQVEDEFSREKKSLMDYLRIISEKSKSAETIDDLTASSATKVLEQIKVQTISDVARASKQVETTGSKVTISEQKRILQGILPDMHLLNWYFFLTEVDEALINCKKCQRWYPVIETIPHMLPDDLRNADEDIAFLKKWSKRIPESILNQGKPFNTKTQEAEKTEKRHRKAR